MRSLLLATTLAVAAVPAYAWDNTNNGNHNQIVDGGPGAQANSAAHANVHLSTSQLNQQSLRNAINNRVTVNVAAPSAAPAASATPFATTAATAPASAPAADPSSSSRTHGGGGYRGSNSNSVTVTAAPPVNLAAFSSGGMDCPTVGLTVGGSGLLGGGGTGVQTISSHCNARKLAELLAALGYSQIAMDVLADEYSVVRKGLENNEQ